MTEKEVNTKLSGIHNQRKGLDIPPTGNIRVSAKPLEEGMREKYKMFVERAKPRIKGMELADGVTAVLALRCGSRFLCSSSPVDSKKYETGTALEIVDYDPTTRRILSIGKDPVPAEIPLIWWGFRVHTLTNFALLLLDYNDEHDKNLDRIEGLWHLDNEGNRRTSIRDLLGLQFPSKVMLTIFTKDQKQKNPSDMAWNEIVFSDGRLILGETIGSLFLNSS